MNNPLKTLFALLMVLGIMFASTGIAEAYVRVNGYTKKNGTYVAPYVRSNPNGLKYDNYSYKPSQGLYNSSYGTRGATWDTPTYITDPSYYEGKALYEQNQVSGYSSYSSQSSYSSSNYYGGTNSSTEYVSGGYKIGGSLYCNSGYYKSNDSCLTAPANSVAYGTEDFYCNSGYVKNGTRCIKPAKKENATFNGTSYTCDSGYVYLGKRCENYPTYCRKTYGENAYYRQSTNSCVTCSAGYTFDEALNSCVSNAAIKQNSEREVIDQANLRLQRKTQNLIVN